MMKIQFVKAAFGVGVMVLLVWALLAIQDQRGDRMVPYVPVMRVFGPDHELVERPDMLTPAHVRRMRAYFASSQYEYVDGVLYIEARLQNDRDLLANYVSKAEAMSEEDIIESLRRKGEG